MSEYYVARDPGGRLTISIDQMQMSMIPDATTGEPWRWVEPYLVTSDIPRQVYAFLMRGITCEPGQQLHVYIENKRRHVKEVRAKKEGDVYASAYRPAREVWSEDGGNDPL